MNGAFGSAFIEAALTGNLVPRRAFG